MARRNLYPSLSVLHREYIASSFSPPSFQFEAFAAVFIYYSLNESFASYAH